MFVQVCRGSVIDGKVVAGVVANVERGYFVFVFNPFGEVTANMFGGQFGFACGCAYTQAGRVDTGVELAFVVVFGVVEAAFHYGGSHGG